MSWIQPPDCSKLAKHLKNDNDVKIFRHDVNAKFFWPCFVFLVKFSYWSKFHVNIITGSGIMKIFFYKGLTRNPKIGNIRVWVLPNIWRLGRVMDTKFGTNVLNRILLNAAKLQSHSFYRFWVIKGKPTGGGGELPPPRTQIRVNISFTNSTIRRASHFLNKLELLRDNIANRNPFVNISLAIFMQGQKINALVIKQLTKAKKLESFTSQSGF